MRARVRGGTDAGCGPSDGQDEVGRVGMGGEVLAWRPGEVRAGKTGSTYRDLPGTHRPRVGQDEGPPSRGRDLELWIQRLTEEAAYGLCRGSRGAGQGQRGGRSGLKARPPQAGTRGDEGGGRSRGVASPLPHPSPTPPPCAECCPQGAYSLMGVKPTVKEKRKKVIPGTKEGCGENGGGACLGPSKEVVLSCD